MLLLLPFARKPHAPLTIAGVLVPLWLCGHHLSDGWAAAGGLLWCLGRVLYALGYYRDPAKREAGFIVGMLACGALVAGSAVGLLLH